MRITTMIFFSSLTLLGFAGVVAAEETAAPVRHAAPIKDCRLDVPERDYALVVLHFDVPDTEAVDAVYARWTYRGGMRKGRMAMDHGIGLR